MFQYWKRFDLQQLQVRLLLARPLARGWGLRAVAASPRDPGPPGRRGAAAAGRRGVPGERGAESGTSPSRSPAPIDNSLDQKLILFVQFIDQPKMAPGAAAAATAAPGVGPHPGAPPPPALRRRRRGTRGGGGPGGPRGARASRGSGRLAGGRAGGGGGRCAGRGLRPGGGGGARPRAPRPPARRIPGESLWGVVVGVKRLPLQEEPPARRSWGWWRCGAAGSGEGQSGHRRRRRRGPARLRPGGRVAGRASALPGPRPAGAPAAAAPRPPPRAVSGPGPRRCSRARPGAPSAWTPGFVYVRAGARGATRRPRSRPALLCACTSGADRPLSGRGPG